MSIDVHPSLRRCLEKKSNSQDHRNEKTSLVATRSCERSQRANYGQGPQTSALLTGSTLEIRKHGEKKHSHWEIEKQLHHGGGGAAAEGHTLRAKGKLAATSYDWKTVLTNSQFQFNFTLLSHWKGSLLAGVQPDRGHAERVGERRRPGSVGSVG